MHKYSDVATKIGKLRVACNSKGITMIASAKEPIAAFTDIYRKRLGLPPQKGKIPEAFNRAVIKAASGREFKPVPFDLSYLSDFQQKVLRALQQVPRGKVKTYGWLAQKAGRPGAARAVGNIMAQNPVPLLIPCHRVVPATGGVGKYGLGNSLKRELLKSEGVDVDRL
jgi:O-6-methylguanine DNA methyltransferase